MSTNALGEIITFYSYKGGTGRSMALSNVACILAERQLKGKGVLMIDWDLEAPGLHKFFHDKFKKRYESSSASANEFTLHLGLLDLFLEIERLTPKTHIFSNEEAEKSAVEVLKKIDFQKFVIETDIPNLSLLKAGSFDKNYSRKVSTFNWVDLYNRSPYLFLSFAEKLVREYNYILIDSRTGYTDIGGICTALLPNKLVAVFVPNRQNYDGILETVQTATDYRRKSEDLRSLLVYPLPTRIDLSLEKLREYWRIGNPDKNINGYQPMFEKIFRDIYGVKECDLTHYFNEVQIQYIPDYAYGEDIAVMIEKGDDKFSLSRSYRDFTKWLLGYNVPWQRSHQDKDNLQAESENIGNEGITYRHIGKYKLAIENYEKSLKISRVIGDRFHEGDQLGNLGNAYRDLGELKKAIKYYIQALKIAREIGDKRNEGIWLGNLGNALRYLTKPKKAIGYYQQSLEISREIGDKRNEGVWLGNLGIAYRDMGESKKEIDYYEKALKIAREIKDRRNEGVWLGNLGIAYHNLGEPEKAIDYYEKALEIAEKIGDKRNEGVWQGYQGDAYRDMGDRKKAIDYYEKALNIAREIGDRRREGKWLGQLGSAYSDLGAPKKAIDFLNESLAIGKSIEDQRIIDLCEKKLKELEELNE